MSQIERDRSPEGRFKYLAEKRVEKAIKAIQSVAKLSDRKNYSYTQDQVSQIVAALEAELGKLKSEFSEKAEEKRKGFEFK